jgi:hypothetical protein
MTMYRTCFVAAVALLLVGAVRADDEGRKREKLPKAVAEAVKAKFPKAEVVGVEDGQTTYEVKLRYKQGRLEATLSPKGQVVKVTMKGDDDGEAQGKKKSQERGKGEDGERKGKKGEDDEKGEKTAKKKDKDDDHEGEKKGDKDDHEGERKAKKKGDKDDDHEGEVKGKKKGEKEDDDGEKKGKKKGDKDD